LISKSNRKDDRHDARTLARLARIDPQLLGPVHRSPQFSRCFTVVFMPNSGCRAFVIASILSLLAKPSSARSLARTSAGEFSFRHPPHSTPHSQAIRMEPTPSSCTPIGQQYP
jgi:hypothetical protein